MDLTPADSREYVKDQEATTINARDIFKEMNHDS